MALTICSKKSIKLQSSASFFGFIFSVYYDESLQRFENIRTHFLKAKFLWIFFLIRELINTLCGNCSLRYRVAIDWFIGYKPIWKSLSIYRIREHQFKFCAPRSGNWHPVPLQRTRNLWTPWNKKRLKWSINGITQVVKNKLLFPYIILILLFL